MKKFLSRFFSREGNDRPDEDEWADNPLDVLLYALDTGYVIKSLGGAIHFVLPGCFDGRECVITYDELMDEKNYHLIRDMITTTYNRPKSEVRKGYITLKGIW